MKSIAPVTRCACARYRFSCKSEIKKSLPSQDLLMLDFRGRIDYRFPWSRDHGDESGELENRNAESPLDQLLKSSASLSTETQIKAPEQIGSWFPCQFCQKRFTYAASKYKSAATQYMFSSSQLEPCANASMSTTAACVCVIVRQ